MAWSGFTDMEAEAISFGSAVQAPVMPDSAAVAAQHDTPKPAATQQARREAVAQTPSNDEVRKMAEQFGEALSRLNHGVHFEIDESTDKVITKIVDRRTHEVIRQIPPEEVVRITHRLREYMGVLLDIEG